MDDEINEAFGELGYDLPATEPEEEKPAPKWVFYLIFLAIGAIIGYFGGVYHAQISAEDFESPYRQQIAQIEMLNNQLEICETTKYNEMILRQTEINLTAMCWYDLELCNYKTAVLLGYNITKPSIVKQLEKDQKEFRELSERYDELERKLGIEERRL